MLTAIQLDDEFLIEAGKVDNIISKGLLPAEFVTIELPAPQVQPEMHLCSRLIVAQLFGDGGGFFVHS